VDKTIKELQKEAFEIAKDHGFHEQCNPLPQSLMLIVTEVSEAMEAHREGCLPFYIDSKNNKPEGIVAELADVIIRVLDTCEEHGWDIQEAINKKMEYNKSRSYRHGDKIC
jgi:NTP pyrophosphatase (non-canonical NTP hydrolase)